MNRDHEDPPGDPPDGDDGEAAPKDNVIAFPGKSARMRAIPPVSPAQSEAPAPGAPGAAGEPLPDTGLAAGPSAEADSAGSDEPGMTLDAFERAVRSAVREKLGDGVEAPPQGADELVAQVFSALTGKDAKSALAEVRQRLAEPLLPSERASEGDVIDLSAVREARQQQSYQQASKVGNALKDTFAGFLAQLSQRPGMSNTITLDGAFFRQHGNSLLGHLFQGLASALMQQARPPDAGAPPAPPVPPPTPAPTADGAPPEDAGGAPPATPPAATPNPSVQVKLDLGSILAGLFRRRDTNPPPEPPRDPPE